MVRGKVRANNDQNVVQVDDFGPQKDTVNEIPGGIYAPTAVTKASAKAIGRRLLAMTKKAEGNEKLMGTLMSSRVQPGDVISYETITDSERKIVLSTRHYLTQRKSDIDINSVDGSIEDILQRFQEVDISSSTRDNEERNRQFSQEEFATAFDYKFKITWRVETREVKDPTGGIAIGIPNRNTVNGRMHLQSTGILINNSGGHAVGTTTLTTDGTNANTVFTSSVISGGRADAFVYRGNGNLLGKVSSATASSVVLATASPDLVADDEELFQISIDSLPESANSHLKIKMNKGTFSTEGGADMPLLNQGTRFVIDSLKDRINQVVFGFGGTLASQDDTGAAQPAIVVTPVVRVLDDHTLSVEAKVPLSSTFSSPLKEVVIQYKNPSDATDTTAIARYTYDSITKTSNNEIVFSAIIEVTP